MGKSKLTAEQVEVLVEKAQAGDTDAFGQIYDNFIDPIYRYIYFRVDKNEALDLTENVFLKVWENLKSYKCGKKYFSAWIYRIAHNLVVDYYRTRKQNVSLEYDIPDEKKHSDPVFNTEQSLSNEILKTAISKLKKKYQQVLLLKYINDLENREIARIMRRTEGSMRILKFRALKQLRQILEEMNITY